MKSIARRHCYVVLEVGGQHFITSEYGFIPIPLEVGVQSFIDEVRSYLDETPEDRAAELLEKYGPCLTGIPPKYDELVRYYKHGYIELSSLIEDYEKLI